jgi:uncharacterized MFS-type transporter YbfB
LLLFSFVPLFFLLFFHYWYHEYEGVGGQLASAGFGLVTLFFGIGQVFAPFIGGWIKDASGTFTAAFFLCTSVAALGALLSYFLMKQPTGK